MINLLKESEDQITSVNIRKSEENYIIIDIEICDGVITLADDHLTISREDWDIIVKAMEVEEAIELDQKV